MTNNSIIEATKNYVRATLKDAEGGHDWFHTLRVYHNAILISKGEKVDALVVALGALLHDIADSKFHDGDDTIGPKMAREFLFKHNVDSLVIEHVIKIIEKIKSKNIFCSFWNSFFWNGFFLLCICPRRVSDPHMDKNSRWILGK